MSSVDFRMSIFWNFTYLLLLFIIRISWRNWNFIHPFGFTYYLSEQIYTENEFFLLKYHFLWLFILVYYSVFRIFWKSSILSVISLQYFFFYLSANFTAQKDCLFLLIDTEKTEYRSMTLYNGLNHCFSEMTARFCFTIVSLVVVNKKVESSIFCWCSYKLFSSPTSLFISLISLCISGNVTKYAFSIPPRMAMMIITLAMQENVL